MKKKHLERVAFFSKEDWAAGHNLGRAEKLLESINLSDALDINDLLELYHVKLYFDNDMFLLSWDDTLKGKFNARINQAWALIKSFWLGIDNENVMGYINQLEFNYKPSFWELVDYFQVYKKIDKAVFVNIMDTFSFQISYILACKNIVQFFDREIRSFLMKHPTSAELLLSRLEEKHTGKRPEAYFPKSLNLADREAIMDSYLNGPDPNVNYVRLIEKCKDSPQLKLSAKLRLKAKRTAAALNTTIFEKGHSWKEGVQVSISKDQQDPVKYSRKQGILEVCYGEDFFNRNKTDISLFQVFRRLFAYLDLTGLITLVSKESELDTLEKVFMQSKHEYVIGSTYQRKSMLAYLQLVIYADYLNRRSLSLEVIIESVVTDFFKAQHQITLQFKFPSGNATYLEKIRTLAPDFEFLLRQYQAFVKEGEIDMELLQINSVPLYFSEIPSLLPKKYAYSDHEKIRYLKYLFFSDQSLLHYVEPFNSQYRNLYDLLVNEEVNIENFANFQQAEIHRLITDDYLLLDANNVVRIKQSYFLFVVGELYTNNVISYWHYPDAIRSVIDDMAVNNLLVFESTLFTKEELGYFNYHLNKKDYTNGIDLRNKYAHGTNTTSEKEHQSDYYILLKLLILAVLKIEDDLLLHQQFS